jgi:hypothetical protein
VVRERKGEKKMKDSGFKFRIKLKVLNPGLTHKVLGKGLGRG